MSESFYHSFFWLQAVSRTAPRKVAQSLLDGTLLVHRDTRISPSNQSARAILEFPSDRAERRRAFRRLTNGVAAIRQSEPVEKARLPKSVSRTPERHFPSRKPADAHFTSGRSLEGSYAQHSTQSAPRRGYTFPRREHRPLARVKSHPLTSSEASTEPQPVRSRTTRAHRLATMTTVASTFMVAVYSIFGGLLNTAPRARASAQHESRKSRRRSFDTGSDTRVSFLGFALFLHQNLPSPARTTT